MSQIQCPNCGGYKIYEVRLNSKSRKPINSNIGVSNSIFSAFLIIIGLGLFMLWLDVSESTIIAVLAVSLVIAVFFVSWRISQFSGEFVSERTCSLCGFKWELRQGEPELPVRVDPNLIYLGAKRLEEEEEALRWAEDEARRRAADD